MRRVRRLKNMKALVIIKGRKNVGKSTSLRKLIIALSNSPESLVLYPQKNGNEEWFFEKREDGLAVIKSKGFTIGVITIGDPTAEVGVRNYLNKCEECKCDFIIASARSKGRVLEILRKYANKHTNFILETTPSIITGNIKEYEDKVNSKFAHYIFDLIKFLNKIIN